MTILTKPKVPDELDQRSPALNDIISRKPDSLIKWSMAIFVSLVIIILSGIYLFTGRKYIRISAYITTIYNSKVAGKEVSKEIGDTLHARAELNPIQYKGIHQSQKVIFQVLYNTKNVPLDAYVGELVMDSSKNIGYADILIPVKNVPSQLSFEFLKTGTRIDGAIITRSSKKMPVLGY